jgi:hypothetical protein
VQATWGIRTEREEGHRDEFFTQLSSYCAYGCAIWKPHGERSWKLARRICLLQGFVLTLEDSKSALARHFTAEHELHTFDCKGRFN